MARFANLTSWLEWQEQLHPCEIDLGLERVARVADRLAIDRGTPTTITIAGTNGKGSVAAMLESIVRQAGRRVGLYRSPHLLRYNERIVIDGSEVDDERLCQAFEQVDQARGDLSLSYFEFGTLAALLLFRQAGVEMRLLEVGLGGRLDAVNLIDADVALITTIDLDHQQWLGNTREVIAVEKAGIMRPGRVAICGDRDPPGSLTDHALAVGAKLKQIGKEFQAAQRADGSWCWQGENHTLDTLPPPGLAGVFQCDNAAVALAALEAIDLLPESRVVATALADLSLPGRLQRITGLGDGEWLVDVAHNPQAARAVAEELASRPVSGVSWLVLGMLADKDVASVVAALRPVADRWLLVDLPPPRGLSAAELAVRTGLVDSIKPGSVAAAIDWLRQQAADEDRVLICGSFLTVAAALQESL
jgi:dihydrofolate synthase/folylpolyglutamate synthase